MTVKPSRVQSHKGKSRRVVLVFGSLVVLIGCGVLLSVMQEDHWSQDNYTQRRVFVLASLLLVTSLGLCYFAMKADKFEDPEEVQLLVVDVPSSGYGSLKASDPPAPYWLTSCVLVPSGPRPGAGPTQARLVALLQTSHLAGLHVPCPVHLPPSGQPTDPVSLTRDRNSGIGSRDPGLIG